MRPDGLFPFHLLWDAPVATLSTKCHDDIIRCFMAIKYNPKRRFELVLEEAAAFAAAGNEQWRIHAQREMWHLEDNPGPPSRPIVCPKLPTVHIPYRDFPMNFWQWPIQDPQWVRTYWVPIIEALFCQEPTENVVTELLNNGI